MNTLQQRTISLSFFLIFLSTNLSAQLTHLGEDVRRKGNGYTKELFTGGLAKLNGKYYFSTPNSNLYITDGTLNGTRVVRSYDGEGITLVKATNKFLYYVASNGYGQWVRQYNPATDRTDELIVEPNRSALRMNGMLVPNNGRPVDQSFVSFEKDKILLRIYNGRVVIKAIHDDDPKNAREVVSVHVGYEEQPNHILWINSQLESVRDEIFWNGIGYDFNKQQGETTITSSMLNKGATQLYKITSNYALLSQGLEIKAGLLRTSQGLYTYARNRADPNNLYWALFELKSSTLKPASGGIQEPSRNGFAEVLDGEIYMAAGGSIFKYQEASKNVLPLAEAKNATFGLINGNNRLLKAGDHIMFRQGDSLGVFNEKTRKFHVVRKPPVYPLTATYDPLSYHAFAGKKAFYYISKIVETPVFNQYDPTTGLTKMISFPKVDKEKFVAIKAILNVDDFFVILTEYTGTKKYGPTYQLFSYREDL